MAKRRLIEFTIENIVECDHCSFVVKNPDPTQWVDGKEFINEPCPVCSNNLLTEKDYIDDLRIQKAINWLNKWFSWLTLFIPKSKKNDTVTIKVHDGMKITK